MSRAGHVLRWLAAGIVVAVIVLGSGRPVSAHASLLTTNPAADSVLDIPPREIVLHFTEPVDPTDESIRLVTANGTPVELGSVTADPGSASLSAAITGELADGSYVVAWSAVSADSHPISGAFVFSVGAPSQDAEALIGDVLGDTTAESGSDLLLGAGRFASYAGIAALTGTLAAVVLLAPSVLNRRRLSTVLFAAGDLAMVGTLAMICAQANLIGASFVDWSAVFSTRSGLWWLARLVIVAVITALVPWRRLLDRRPVQVLAAVTSLVLFAVVAAGGHSVSGRWIGLAFTATVVHLAAMALWLGGLVLIVVVVDKPSVFSIAWRFSPLALSAVTLLAVTGFFNGWRQLGDLDSLSDSSYGRWLLIKLAVVGAVVTVAAASRWIIRNAATAVVSVQPASVGAAASTSPSNELPLRRTLMIEVAGMIVILAATAGLTGATPPQQADATTSGNATVSVVSDDQLAQIELLPAITGGTTMHVTSSSPAGSL
jgi:copper transport protein